MYPTTICPRCGRRTIRKRDGIFAWRACPATQSCGWTVFTHTAQDDVTEMERREAARAAS